MKRRLVSEAFLLVLGILLGPLPALAQIEVEPATGEPIRLLPLTEVPQSVAAPVFGDIVFVGDSWLGSDITSGNLVWFNSSGTVVKSFFLGVDASNIYPIAGRVLFAGTDSTQTSVYGGYFNLKSMKAQLPAGFFSTLGGDLSGSPNGYGVVTSRSLSSVLYFQKDYATTPASRSLSAISRGMDFGPGGNWYIGSPTGLNILTQSWNVFPFPNYSGNTTAVRGCGDALWVGGPGYVDWWQDPAGNYSNATFRRFSGFGSSIISSIDCGQNGTAVAVGSNRMIFYLDPSASSGRAFQSTGTSSFVKVSNGPGLFPGGFILDNFGNVGRFALPSDIQYSADRNSAPTRRIGLGLRTVF